MQQPVDSVLEDRARALARGRRAAGVAGSVLLHGGLVAMILLVPFLASRNRPPIEFVAVRIVPVQALGVERPQPAPPSRPEPEPPAAPIEPEPEPETPEPQPAPSLESKRTTAPPPEPREPAPAPAPRQRQGSPTGSSTGTAPFGATAVAGLDNPDFVYGYYVDQMLAMIGAHWIRPPVGGGIETVVRFRIARNGQITELEVVTSSGNRSFDQAGLRAVQRANPLPPLPQSFRSGSLGVNLVIR